MSNFNHLECLKVRAAWLAEAVSNVTGTPVIRGVKRYNLYSELLGFENHSSLVNLYNQNPTEVGRIIDRDWDASHGFGNQAKATAVFNRYYQRLTSQEVYECDLQSMPWIEKRLSERYQRVAKKMFSRDQSLLYLRCFQQQKDELEYLTTTLITLSGTNQSHVAKYQIRIIIVLLKALHESGYLEDIKLGHVIDFLYPDNFNLLVDQYFDSNLGVTCDIGDDELINNYYPRWLDLVGADYKPLWESLVPPLCNLIGRDDAFHHNAYSSYANKFVFGDTGITVL